MHCTVSPRKCFLQWFQKLGCCLEKYLISVWVVHGMNPHELIGYFLIFVVLFIAAM
jgi:hypothetical protein